MTMAHDLRFALRYLARAKGPSATVVLAIGSQPGRVLIGVLMEGLVMAGLGVAVGGAGGLVLARLIGSYVQQVPLPGPLPVIGAVTALLVAALVASVVPAARATRVDVMRALRAEP
jgi:putative ABC transport system permease protein